MQHSAPTWPGNRTSRWQDWPAHRLVELKERRGASISVVIPARNEERTVAGVVAAIGKALMGRIPLVDELVVMDSDSTDETAAVAGNAGATVYQVRDVAPDLGSYPGKGEALWKSLLVTKGDLLVFVDADLTRWGPHFIMGLLGPLLADDQVRLVKGFYTRVRTESDGSTSTEGGRVTELVARPLLNLWWPELADVVQPLAGEWAARRTLMESLRIPVGYGVELATLMDTVARHGLDAVAQVDLGTRAHRHQANHDLALMSAELLVVAERRRRRAPEPPTALLKQFVREDGQVRVRIRPVPVDERPPAASLTDRSSAPGDGRPAAAVGEPSAAPGDEQPGGRR
ncbi:MAG TPA: glucosyl-3-phosphoglycerate synthase [Streptosporangiaceae bacterium]|nr:glucosyl-3-phosphoglycerate synthase [Streptosporangiaceae bacterium]